LILNKVYSASKLLNYKVGLTKSLGDFRRHTAYIPTRKQKRRPCGTYIEFRTGAFFAKSHLEVRQLGTFSYDFSYLHLILSDLIFRSCALSKCGGLVVNFGT